MICIVLLAKLVCLWGPLALFMEVSASHCLQKNQPLILLKNFYWWLGEKHRNICLHFFIQMFRCKLEKWIREAEICRQGLSQSVRCGIVWWIPHDAHCVGSLSSSIWQSQPQTTAAHTSCLKDERMLFAAVPAFQCLFHCSDKAMVEGSEREAASRTRTRKGSAVFCSFKFCSWQQQQIEIVQNP